MFKLYNLIFLADPESLSIFRKFRILDHTSLLFGWILVEFFTFYIHLNHS